MLWQKIAIGVVLIVLSGCAGNKSLLLEPPKVSIIWPPPPEVPRIKFLREIRGFEDVALPKGKLGKMLQFFTGDSSEGTDLVNPYGIVSDGEDFLYVADPQAGVVHKFDLVKREATYIGKAGHEPLVTPVAVALDRDGNIFISDSTTARVYKFDGDGTFLRYLEPPTPFRRPAGIAINSLGEKIVVDVVGSRIFVFDKEDHPVAQFPKPDSGYELAGPTNVAVDRDNNIYVTDSLNFTVNMYDHDGNLKRSIGQVGDGPGSFAKPKGVAVDSDGNIYVVDGGHDNFQVFNSKGELLLVVGSRGKGPGKFSLPTGIAIDKHDRIYIADAYNHRIQIFQYVKQGRKQ